MFTHIKTQNITDLSSNTSSDGVRFYTTPYGDNYPSVTTILGATGDKSWLTEWKAALGEKKAEHETNRCSTRGSAVHELVEHYLNNEHSFMRGYAPEHVHLFNQLKLRLKKVNNIRTQEASLFSDELKIAGRVDCIGEYKGKLSIIDFKTSNNNKSKDMIYDYYLQCTAYSLMWYEMTGELIENITIIMAVERGLTSMVFQETIHKYIKPLYERINTFYESQGIQNVC